MKDAQQEYDELKAHHDADHPDASSTAKHGLWICDVCGVVTGDTAGMVAMEGYGTTMGRDGILRDLLTGRPIR